MGFFSSLFKRAPAPAGASASPRGVRSNAADPQDEVHRLRSQARRRLIGAALLIGLGVLAFPLVFETQPRPVPMDLPIVIPAKDAAAPGAAPGLDTAAVKLPDDAELQRDPAPPPVAAGQGVESGATPAPPSVPTPAAPPVAQISTQAQAPDAPSPVPASAAPAPGAETSAKPPAEARFVLQVGAYADKKAARSVRERLERKGLKTYAQAVKTADGERIRVRLGPYGSKAEAERAQAGVKAAGLDAKLLTL